MKKRIDSLLVDKNLVESREKARAMIMAGEVTVDGRAVIKAGIMVDDEAEISLAEPPPFVSRGGIKLDYALDRFGIADNPSAVKATLFGPVVYYKNNRKFDFIRRLGQMGESATLSWDNLAGIDRIEVDGTDSLYTCENESPLHQ